VVEQFPKLEGRQMVMVLAPKKKAVPEKVVKPKAEQQPPKQQPPKKVATANK
jgi:translation initiation factor IF-3